MSDPRAIATWVAATAAIVLSTGCGEQPSPETAAIAAVIRGAQTAQLNPETARTELTRYYVGTLLDRKVTELQGGIRQTAEVGGGGRVGGVKTLDLRNVRVSGNSANVKAEVTVWFKTAQFWYQPVTNQPQMTNIIDLDLHLVKDGSTWKIDQEQWQFAPGGGP